MWSCCQSSNKQDQPSSIHKSLSLFHVKPQNETVDPHMQNTPLLAPNAYNDPIVPKPSSERAADSNVMDHRPALQYAFKEYPTMPNSPNESQHVEEEQKYRAPILTPEQQSVMSVNRMEDTNEISHALTTHNLLYIKDSDSEDGRAERSTTLSTHTWNAKKRQKERQSAERHSGFRIPLISQLLPQSTGSSKRRGDRSFRDRINILGGAKKNRRKFVDIVLGFRGTDSNVNVKLDLKFKRQSIDPSFWYGRGGGKLDESLTNSIRWKKCVRKCIVNKKELNPLNVPTVKVHSGFYQSFADIRQQLLQTVLTTYYRILRKKKIPRFYVTGHSLGGALAQLCGLCLEILFGHRSPIHSLVPCPYSV